MALSEQQIKQITEDIVRSLSGIPQQAAAPASGAGPGAAPADFLFATADQAVAAAKQAQGRLSLLTLDKRAELIEAMRQAAIRQAESLAKLAHDETGYGRVAHKVQKNLLVARRTPGTEDLVTTAKTGDLGMMISEQVPFGVVGSITPSTNPTSTVINNAISIIAAGNAVVFNPHPAARRSSQETMRILNEAIVSAGGPAGLITAVREPSMESGQAIMMHPDVPLLSITGGEAVVKVAMKTGKRVIAAGPGNPPVIVDESADIPAAARDIVDGASFDNNVMCICEKEVFAASAIFDGLMDEMRRQGGWRIQGGDIERVMAITLIKGEGRYSANRKYIGKDAAVILRDAGVSFQGEPRLILAEVPDGHPFVMTEMLMPVLPLVRVGSFEEALAAALHAEQGCRHSAMIHSTNVHHLSRAAKAMNTTLFVKNAPCYAGLGFGGEGFTTMTIATPTGEGVTSARSFTRARRCVLYGDFRIC
ncbi:MAG: aldehyde dehydrogenase family protein [Christensenellales bacterium]